MKVWTIQEPGSRDQLLQVDRPTPQPQEEEILVKVKAFGINRTDILTRMNTSLKLPYPVLGVELAGEVVENRSERGDLKMGTRVMGLVEQGSYSEYAVMPADYAMVIPESLSYEQAAAIPEVFLTAYQCIYWLGQLEKGQSILIHAGASGVGTAAIQLAKVMSQATVIATSSKSQKLEVIDGLGADLSVNYKEVDIAQAVFDRTNGRGVDVVLDFVGASYFKTNLKSIAIDGRWVLIGTLGGSQVKELELMDFMKKRIQLKATLLTPRPHAYKAQLRKEFEQNVLPLITQGHIKTLIYEVLDFNRLTQAHQMMEENENIGKIIVTIPSNNKVG